MSDSDPTVQRIVYSAGNVLGVNVMSIQRPDWHDIVNLDGSPTRLERAPEPLAAVHNDAMVVAVAASGVGNSDPGIEIARNDPEDDPYIINIDRYTAIETITMHSSYPSFLRRAGVSDSQDLQDALNKNVYIVKRDPATFDEHWCEQLPDRIRNAKAKS